MRFGTTHRTLASWASALALLLLPSPGRAGNDYYGGDLDQDKAKDIAKGIGDKFKNQGYNSKVGSDISAKDLCDDLKTQFKDEIVDGKFKCDGGVLFVYVSAHGGDAADRNGNNQSYIGNPKKPGAVNLQDWTKCVVDLVPKCCTLIFTFDVCASDAWWDNNFDKNGNPRDGSPFKSEDLNYVVGAPVLTNKRCIGTPVGDAITNGFKQRRTAFEYQKYLGESVGVRSVSGLDDQHGNYVVVTPEPPAGLTLTGALALCLARRRRLFRPRPQP